MAWPTFDGKPYTREQFQARVERLDAAAVARWCKFITLHHTGIPDLRTWYNTTSNCPVSGCATPQGRIYNIQSFYERPVSQGGRGWNRGPHLFIDREYIWGFSDLSKPGIHASCFNSNSIGIEMVGNYDGVETFDPKVRDLTAFAIAVLSKKLGLTPAPFVYNTKGLHFHRDCERDHKSCPGKNVQRNDMIAVIQGHMTRLGASIAEHPAPLSAPVPLLPLDRRTRMVTEILPFEARLDAQGRVQVYKLPPEDTGGTYEVAGINDRYHPAKAAELKALVQAGRHEEAKRAAIAYYAQLTDVAATWTDDGGVEFFARDTILNRGLRGAGRIIQNALMPDDADWDWEVDGVVGPKTKTKIKAMEPLKLIDRLVQAREQHERDVMHRDENNRLWNGLNNRWVKAKAAALRYHAEFPGTVVAAPANPDWEQPVAQPDAPGVAPEPPARSNFDQTASGSSPADPWYMRWWKEGAAGLGTLGTFLADWRVAAVIVGAVFLGFLCYVIYVKHLKDK